MGERQPRGILDFWTPPPATPETVRKQVDLHPVRFEGQRFWLVLDAPDQAEAEKVLGRVLKALFAHAQSRFRFRNQSLSIEPPTGPADHIVLGDVTLHALATTHDLVLLRKMTIDRLAYALSDCRNLPGAARLYDDIGLQIVRKA
jgi:hypothetical protein